MNKQIQAIEKLTSLKFCGDGYFTTNGKRRYDCKDKDFVGGFDEFEFNEDGVRLTRYYDNKDDHIAVEIPFKWLAPLAIISRIGLKGKEQ